MRIQAGRADTGAGRPARRMAALLAVLLLGGCSTLEYFGQSISGEYEILSGAQPIDALLADSRTAPDLRARLTEVKTIREFASRELALPDNGSYRRYTDVGRAFVAWNVFAAPELSSTLMTWCFPVAGCVAYRGYFSEADARKFADGQKKLGLDVYVGGVPAYSTLGYFDDPMLSTFIHYPDTEIARLLFHELGHQVAYAADDSTFNESFAVTVEREGMRRFLAGAPPARATAFAESEMRRGDFATLVGEARQRLETAYAAAADDAARRAAKSRIIDELRQSYARLKAERWNGFAGYDAFFATDLNNAKLGSVAVYTARVPAFEGLLRRVSGDLPRFYAEVRKLAKMTKAERDAILDAAEAKPVQAATE